MSQYTEVLDLLAIISQDLVNQTFNTLWWIWTHNLLLEATSGLLEDYFSVLLRAAYASL